MEIGKTIICAKKRVENYWNKRRTEGIEGLSREDDGGHAVRSLYFIVGVNEPYGQPLCICATARQVLLKHFVIENMERDCIAESARGRLWCLNRVAVCEPTNYIATLCEAEHGAEI